MKKDLETALVIVRDEILHQYGSVYADATLTCKQSLMFGELLCHERWVLLGDIANQNIARHGRKLAFTSAILGLEFFRKNVVSEVTCNSHFTLAHDYRPKSGHLDNIVPTYLFVYQLEGKS